MTTAPPTRSQTRSTKSLVARIDSWGRLTGTALGVVTVVLLAQVVLNTVVFNPQVDRALRGTTTVRRVHQAMLDQQVGLRGYLMSGEESYLESYTEGAAELPEWLDQATDAIAGQDELGEHLVEMRLALQTWIDRWALPTLELVSDGGRATDEVLAEDKQLFDAYRVEFESLIDDLLRERRRVVDNQQRAQVIGLSVALLVTIGGGWLALRRIRALRRSVSEPVDQLLGRIAEIGRGELDPAPPVEGPLELMVLSDGLEQTATVLADARDDANRRAEQQVAHSRRQDAVLTFAREVAGSLSLRYVLRGVCTHASSVAEGARVIVWLMTEGRRTLEPYADSTGPDMKAIGIDPVEVGDGIVGRAGQYGKVLLGEAGDATAMAVPMVVGAQVAGVLAVCDMDPEDLTVDVRSMLETMAIHSAMALDAARLHERTSDMAMTDGLTGLPNRRRLEDDLDIECAASARYGRPLAFLMVDVDHFKSYNDEFGHQAGDATLQAVARILGHDLRPTDRAYRFGGEEFSLLLRETTLVEAHAVAERLRAAVEHHFTSPLEPRAVTISIGVAALPGPELTPNALVRTADAALYEAKHAGRNTVRPALESTSADEPAAPPDGPESTSRGSAAPVSGSPSEGAG